MAKILLVEDDNNLREIYEARLQAEGYTIVAAQDGEEALVVAKREKPDLVISDVMMPRISGFEMLDILRNTEGMQTVKVIMLTALGQAEDKTRADSLGADRYLVKSQVTLEDIVKAAQELLGPDQGPAAPQAAAAAAEQVAALAAQANAAAPPPAAPQAPAIASPVPNPAAPPEPTPAPVVAAPVATVPVAPAPPVPTPPSAAPPEPVAPGPAPEPPQAQTTPPVPTPTVPTPVQTSPTAPQPVSEPPTPAPMPVAPAPAPGDTSSAAQSTSDETAAVKAQIDSFISQNTQTAPSPTDQAMANAIKNLVSDASAPPAVPAPEKVIAPPSDDTPAGTGASASPTLPTTKVEPAEVKQDDGVAITGKKVIQPLSQPTTEKPVGLDELLAKEGINSLDDEQHAGPTAPPTSTTPGLPIAPHPPGHVISPNGANGGVDPNSIAL